MTAHDGGDSSVEELRASLQALRVSEADAYFHITDTMAGSQAQWIIDTATTKRLPTMFHEQGLASKGALASYGQSYHEIGRLSAKYVQRVLNGARPGDLHIETADTIQLSINLKTAKLLGLTIAPEMLMRADKIIK